MRQLLAITLACVVVFPAAAAEPFDSFKALCIDANGDPEVASTRATTAGWASAPDWVVDEFKSKAPYENVRVWINSKAPDVAATPFALLTADAREIFPGAKGGATLCSVFDLSGTSKDLPSDLRSWIGFDPAQGGDSPLWLYSLTGSGPKAETSLLGLDEQAIAQVLAERQIYMVGVIAGAMPSYAFIVPEPFKP